MKYGIFGDIHGNLEALERVLAVMQEEGVTKFLCLGDIVGYGADPQACLELVQSLDSTIVVGNHDLAVTGKIEAEDFNLFARTAVFWCRSQLLPEHLDFLNSLPYVEIVNDEITLFHATLNSPERFDYMEYEEDLQNSFELLKTPLGVFGHTHVPVIYAHHDEQFFELELEEVVIEKETAKYIINPGSVGQPRDYNPMAGFAIYDDDTKTFTQRRVEYDIEKAQEKIIAAGLPEFLSMRLGDGM